MNYIRQQANEINLQNLFIIDFESGIGAKLMPLFQLRKWKISFVYGTMESTYTGMGWIY